MKRLFDWAVGILAILFIATLLIAIGVSLYEWEFRGFRTPLILFCVIIVISFISGVVRKNSGRRSP